jgi:hypothetical protein
MKHELGTEARAKPLTPEKMLANAVIVRGLMDSRAKNEAIRSEAAAWIASDAFDAWCAILGVPAKLVREKITRGKITINGWGGSR